MKPKFKILSIDGGGIRGIIPCTILKFIEEQTGNSISDMFDVIAGTSTGGIITLGLTAPDKDGGNKFTAEQMLDLYLKNGKDIFPPRHSKIGEFFSKAFRGALDQPYDDTGLKELLKNYFDEAKLSDALANILITTYDIEKGEPYYFSSTLAQSKADKDFFFRDVARSTSSAPSYFKTSQLLDEDKRYTFVDGGVFANNPSILAYCEAKELWKTKNKPKIEQVADNSKGFGAVVTADDNDLPFYMLSIGTFSTICKVKAADLDETRTIQMVGPLLSDVFSRSVAQSTHDTMQHLLPPYETGSILRYERLDDIVPDDASQMDNVSDENMQKLKAIGEAFIEKNKAQLLAICQLIK